MHCGSPCGTIWERIQGLGALAQPAPPAHKLDLVLPAVTFGQLVGPQQEHRLNEPGCLPSSRHTQRITQEHQKALDTSIHNRPLAGHAHCAGEGAELSRRVDVESEGY